MARRIAGWALLSLLPLTLVTLALIAGQLAEMAVGAGIAALCFLAATAGIRLLTDKKGQS